MTRFAFLAALLFTAAALRRVNNNGSTVEITQHDVDMERQKLNNMAVGLEGMLKGQSLAHSKVAPSLKLFTSNLESVLASSKSMKPADAMKQLEAAKAGVSSLLTDMTHHQEALMKEDVAQREDVLLGVLMTHKGDAMDKQLEILKSADFAVLPVAKALLQKHDDKSALYLQAAQYLDQSKSGSATISTLAQNASRVEEMAVSLEKRVATLERQGEVRLLEHKKRMDKLNALIKKGDKHSKARLHHEEREFKKTEAMNKQDVESMKAAVAAIRKGDMKALAKAQEALKKSMQELKNKNGDMLVFLQKGHAYLERDCPFCVAQCVGKCHDSGKPYTACLTECADAGK